MSITSPWFVVAALIATYFFFKNKSASLATGSTHVLTITVPVGTSAGPATGTAAVLPTLALAGWTVQAVAGDPNPAVIHVTAVWNGPPTNAVLPDAITVGGQLIGTVTAIT